MKYRKHMLLGTIVISFLLAGNYYLSSSNLDYLSACPNDEIVNQAKQVIGPTQVAEASDLSSWSKTAKVSSAKFPSGVNIYYKFDRLGDDEKNGDHSYNLTLRYTDVVNQPAVAYAYPHSGAKMVDAENVVYRLKNNATNEVSIVINAKPGTGGVAVVTCQNKRKSVISIDLPGYKL